MNDLGKNIEFEIRYLFLTFLDTDMDRLRQVVTMVNDDYVAVLSASLSLTMESLYDKLIEKHPYRLMANFSYEWNEKKIRRTFNVPSHTEVFYNFSIGMDLVHIYNQIFLSAK